MKQVLLLVAAVFFTVLSNAQDAAEKINQANQAMNAKDYAKAYTLYDEAMNNLGDVQVNDSINYYIGLAACESGNVEGAEKYMEKAIKANVNISDCYENLGDLYKDKKAYDKAVANYEKAIENTENKDALILKVASAAYNGNDFDKAIKMFDKLIQNGYKAEAAYFNKANAYKKQNKDAEYKATLEEGAAKFPNDAKIAPALAKLYFNEGNVLYNKGKAIMDETNKKVTAGSLKTDAPAYATEVNKAKPEFEAALKLAEKAKALDATNKNAENLINACNVALKK